MSGRSISRASFACAMGRAATVCNHPLTVVDGASRYLLGCRARPSVSEDAARPVFEQPFRDFGLPAQILSDNGQPFASSGLGSGPVCRKALNSKAPDLADTPLAPY